MNSFYSPVYIRHFFIHQNKFLADTTNYQYTKERFQKIILPLIYTVKYVSSKRIFFLFSLKTNKPRVIFTQYLNTLSLKPVGHLVCQYSSLSNNREGCNKHAVWKNLQNLGYFKHQKVFKIPI